MTQTWRDLLFAHWPVPVERLRPLIPAPLCIDTYGGQAWIGVIPFHMTGVGPRWLPALPWFSAFPELNVRTYVVVGDRPGVWFFSLDAGNPLAVALARLWYHLPYFNARMSVRVDGEWIQYSSQRVQKGDPVARFRGRYRPRGSSFASAPGSLDHWLTERYCLYSADAGQRVYRAEIHHPPWSLQRAEARVDRNTMTVPIGIELPNVPPLLHFSRRQDAVAWSPRRLNV